MGNKVPLLVSEIDRLGTKERRELIAELMKSDDSRRRSRKGDDLASALLELFRERRSDVADICARYLENHILPETYDVEHRYVNFQIPVQTIEGERYIDVEYDTLTTEATYKFSNSGDYQEVVNVFYSND